MAELNLDDLPLLDHHCHALRRLPERLSLPEWATFFTESRDAEQVREHVPQTLFFRFAVRELAAWLGCAPEAEAVLAARAAMGEAFAPRMLAEAGLEALYLDTGFASKESASLEEMAAIAPCPVRAILRLESLLESLIPESPDLEGLLERFLDAVRRAPGEGYVALKSIAAYRTGLEIGDPPEEAAAAGFVRARETWAPGARPSGASGGCGRLRLADPDLLHFCLRRAFLLAGEIGLPVQLHTGFGDADADLRTANPLHLRALLEEPSLRPTTFVLLHAGYPYARETAHLAGIYGNVYMDTSLAIPLTGPLAASLWRDAFALAPVSKLLAASDAFGLPEHFWLAARWSRRSLARVLDMLIDDGALDLPEARAAAAAILAGNARRIYPAPCARRP
jgi:predicted TIM-barrel fold metal-dependent hydrolase